MVKRRLPNSWTSAAARRLSKMAGDPPTIEDAIRIVAHGILSGVACPPTDLEAIKPQLNITEISSSDLPIMGELRRNGSGHKILYSSALTPEQRRFTIAHEMGHAIFETTGPNCPRSGDELERLCDMLATEILLPSNIFSEYLSNELSIQKLLELKRTFKTSLSATAIRCAELRRVSVFEVENDKVVWAYGVVKKGLIKTMDGAIKRSIEEALSGKCEQRELFLKNTVWNVTNSVWRGPWKLEWQSIGREKRAFFLLQPIIHQTQ